MPIIYYEGALRLGMAIILARTEEYKLAYRKGYKNKLDYYERMLRSIETDIITDEKISGVALVDALRIRCEKKYGNFDVVYEREQKKKKELIDTLNKEAQLVKTNKARKEINNKIRRLQGEIVK